MIDSTFHERVHKELAYIQYPEKSWIEPSHHQYDVVVIGAGMAGLAASFALKKLGITKIKIFDKAPQGYEGPWATYARMPTLRSGKDLVGPAIDVPLLTFQAWYEARFGKQCWDQLGKIPTQLWMDYLRWFRTILNLDIENGRTLNAVQSGKSGLQLLIDDQQITTRKLILATGRAGFGGSKMPHFVERLPRECYADVNGYIDFEALQGKKVAIIGGGASGFDAAYAALDASALHVDIILRRREIPYVNKAASITYSGFSEGYYHLEDDKRWKFMEACYRLGAPPPHEAVERVINDPRFSIVRDVKLNIAKRASSKISLETSIGILSYDYLIVATGFDVDIGKQMELQHVSNAIQLWSDRESIQGLPGPSWFHRSPYLGPHFQFLEKKPGTASYLQHIYCFNYAATLSHGLLSGDIPGIGTGASRLARGIASDFFVEGWTDYHQRLEEFQLPELAPSLR